MPSYDFTAARLYVAGPLAAGTAIACDHDRVNYLVNVLRLQDGGAVLVFDGASGEWRARLQRSGRKAAVLVVEDKVREQTPAGDLWLMFAPLKHARLDYMVQKAVEMGASRLMPVITRHTQVTRLNRERMLANAAEAAEQCGILHVPDCDEPRPLASAFDLQSAGRLLIVCDEAAEVANPVEALRPFAGAERPLAVLIGPEGGFSEAERRLWRARPETVPISLGPRILRADTAAVAALAVVQAALGDWR